MGKAAPGPMLPKPKADEPSLTSAMVLPRMV
jgi:hypothetical protein